MKKILLCSLFFLLFTLTIAADDSVKTGGFNISTGLAFNYSLTPMSDSEGALENELLLLTPLLLVEVEIFDYVSFGLAAGFNLSYFRQTLDFQELPLSLRLDQERFSGPVFGIYVKSDPVHFGDFLIKARAAYMYYLHGGREWPITLPVESGSAHGASRISELSAEVLLGYQVFSGLRFFVGPHLNLTRSRLKLDQAIGLLAGEQETVMRQQDPLGLLLGVSYDLGSHWEITCKAVFFSRTALNLEFLYVF